VTETTRDRMIRLAREGDALPRPTYLEWLRSLARIRRRRYYLLDGWQAREHQDAASPGLEKPRDGC
jgi:hypothetical protein